ncbi:MAG: hypothetical protein QXZ17_05610 [Nitrososphaerota archaeon]
MRKRWIQRAIKRPGALRAYVKRHYGSRGFTEKGTIKVSILRKLAKRRDKVGARARLALTLRRLR